MKYSTNVIMLLWLTLMYLFDFCTAEIYHLSAVEYSHMPALFSLDEYEACLSEEGGSYCMLKVELFAEPDNQLMNVIHEYSAVTTKHYNHTYLERGVCVKRQCNKFLQHSNTTNLTSALTACINDTIYQEYGLNAKVNIYYCDEHNQTTVHDALDWYAAVLFIGILLVNVIATLYDYVVNIYNEKDTQLSNEWMTSFSVIRNWRWLVSAEPDEERIKRLKGLHGTRSFTNICIILAHVFCILASGFSARPQEIEKSYEAVYYQIIYNGMMMVQVFFLVSGFLLVYHFKVNSEKQKYVSWKTIPTIMFIRWWRLSPALGVMLLFSSTWLRHLGSGPLWKLFVTSSVVGDCRSYWWAHLLYINNYMPEDKFCMIQTWHISADTQMFLVGVVVYISTQSHVLCRYIVLTILLLLGIVLPALHVYFWDLEGLTIMYPEFYRTMSNETFRYLHVLGHNNLTCFIIGMGIGELIYYLQQEKYQISRNKIINLITYLVIPLLVIMMYSGHVFYVDGPRASLAVRMLYASLHRLGMGLLVGFGLVCLVMKCDTPLRHIFEWQGWVVPSRLSYSIFLLHFNLIYIYMGSRTELEHISFYYLMVIYIGFVGLSFICALPLFLLVEAPVNRLLKTLMDLGKSRQGEVKIIDSFTTEIEDEKKNL